MGSAWQQTLAERETGAGGCSLESKLLLGICKQLQLSKRRKIRSPHAGGVTWLDLDDGEHRYLLSGAADATIAVHDTLLLDQPTTSRHDQSSTQGPGIKPLCVVSRSHPGAHQYMVSCVCWYPVDSGMFVSGGHDNVIKLWDTNMLEVVSSWDMGHKVYGCSMSRAKPASSRAAHATQHLIAAAVQDPALRLCDVRTSTFSHTLVGHRHPIWSVCWSLRDEHQLLSGDSAGQVLVWDIRKFGPRVLLDQYKTDRPIPASNAKQELRNHGESLVTSPQRVTSSPAAPSLARLPNRSASVGHSNRTLPAVSAPVDLTAVLNGAWDTMGSHLQHNPSRQITAKATTTPTRKRSAPDALPDIRRSSSTQAHGTAGISNSRQEVSPFQRLPLHASAPVRPGRTGDVIGGHAPIVGSDSNSNQSGTAAASVKAHQGSVTCIAPTADGLFWLTAGTDSRLRLWDSIHWQRHVSGYADTHNRAIRARQIALTQDGRVVFHPSGSIVQVFDVRTSALLNELQQGHTESINACVWNPLSAELYTAANDSQILVWAHKQRRKHTVQGVGGHGLNADNSSDSSDTDDGNDGDGKGDSSNPSGSQRPTHISARQTTNAAKSASGSGTHILDITKKGKKPR